MDKTPDELAASDAFDEVIATAAAGDFAALGWSTEPLTSSDESPDDGFVPATVDDFLNFPTQ